jgi:AraC-like DNA-binding protein
MNGRTISAAWAKGIRETFHGAGLDPDALFREAGLDLTELNNHEARFAPEKISLLWEIATERSGNSALGVTVPEASTPISFDAVAYVMMSCRDLLTGLEHLIRYLRIISNAAELTLVKETDGYAFTVELVTGERPLLRQRVEFVIVTVLNFCRRLTGRQLYPLQVDLVHPAPDNLQSYNDAFGCAIHFGAPLHRMLFSDCDLTLPLPTSNPVLAELHDRHAAEYLYRLDDANVTNKTRELIVQRLPDGDPSRAEIAKALCMSERTLQRRLQDESTSYHELLDETRQDLARRYMRQPELTLAQITYLLGFGEQSTFSRACKRWFDLSPGEYRLTLKRAPSSFQTSS